MAVLPILTGADHPLLRKKTKHVPSVTKEVKRLLRDMRATVKAAEGAGLAAPQVGSDLRVCLAMIGGKEMALINAEIVKRGAAKETDLEGCLSLPGLEVRVPRHTEIVVTFLDEKGAAKELRLLDFDARVVQHELDHLDGVLIVDYADPIVTRE